MSMEEQYIIWKHKQVCKKFWHGKKCIEQFETDLAFLEIIKGENK